MSGPKAYTMREMKGIVQYLVENKAYSKYRGQKMWVDFAKSSLTKRTWQSLKETFLKRILPDIQNPYYQLTQEQVCSFKQGCDVEAKDRNRLEIQTVHEESSTNENRNKNGEPSTSAANRNEAENTIGEIIKSAAITARNRSSADTLILDDPEVSKKTTEQLLADLEEPTTSMNDCLNMEYSETPTVVREVLQDFETESEGSDNNTQMEVLDDSTDDIVAINEEVIIVEDSEPMDNIEYVEEERIIVEGGMEVDIGPTFDHEIITDVSSTELHGLNTWLDDCDQEVVIPAESNKSGEAGDDHETTAEPNADANQEEYHNEIEPAVVIEDSADNSTKNSLSTTSDTIIPNNQEEINEDPQSLKCDALAQLATSRKRTTSQDKTMSKKTKLDNVVEKNNVDSATPLSSNNTEALFEGLKKSDHRAEDTQDAQYIDDTPHNKNPCLKSVSLFDEQFNTTKYSDSDEDTPIPNNGEKIVVNIVTAEDKNLEVVKDLPPNDKDEVAMNVDLLDADKQDKTPEIDPPVKEQQDKTEKDDSPIEVHDHTAKVNPPVEKKHEETTKVDSLVEKNYEEITKDDLLVEKNHEETTKLDPLVEKNHEETTKLDPLVEKNNEKTSKVDPLVEKNHEKTKVEKKRKETTKVDLLVEKNHEETTKLDPLVEKNNEKTSKVDPLVEKNHEKTKVEKKRKETAKVDLLVEKKHKETTKIDPLVEKNHEETTKVYFPDQKKQDVIVLKSNSDSDEIQPTVTVGRPNEQFKHLAHAFGFIPGTSVTATQRRRSLRSRNRTKSQRNSCSLQKEDLDGSISEPELADSYISPPRDPRNRLARRYRKPQPGNIMSLEEDGALFVVHGTKVFPIVKNGKNLTFVTYDNLGESEEEEEIMWRQKYIEEKRKTAELKRQLEEFTDTAARSKSPILQNPPQNIASNTSNKTVQSPAEADINKQINIKQIGDAGKIQITLSKNKETVNLEGHWPQVLPIVQQVMSIFYKSDDKLVEPEPTISELETSINKLQSPIIDLDERRVDEIEGEIFKEIEEKDKEDKIIKDNVTKRKAGRPKKALSTNSEQSEKSEKTAKKPRKSKKTETKDKKENTLQSNDAKKVDIKEENAGENQIAEVIQPEGNKTKRKLSVTLSVSDRLSVESAMSSMQKVEEAKDKIVAKNDTDNVSVKAVSVDVIQPRVTRARKSGNETDSSTHTTSSTRTITTRLSSKAEHDEDEVRYMLPPGPKTRKMSLKKAGSLEPHEISQDRFRNSIDSSQGYQDSDASPAKVAMKQKRKISVNVRKGKYTPRRKSFPTLASVHDMSLNSSNSSYFVPKKSTSQSTLDSVIYKTESYQILMENRKQIKKLNIIEESCTSDLGHFNAVCNSGDSSQIVVEPGSSSSVSLPLSPELSVVENLSISREMIRGENHPTINEMQANDSIVSHIYNQYLISELDVSVPLMQQDCKLLNTPGPAKNRGTKQKTSIKVSELLNKVCTVDMTVNRTLSDSLDRKLRDLLLESAKKISNTDKENLMDVDESEVEPKQVKAKKRCSTPRKRNTKKTKAVVGPVIDEHMESCSGGRNSCPPVITVLPIDENANNSSDVQLNKPKPKPRVKKDVIKVKIQRPKRGAKLPEATAETSQISIYTDSGINETASISGVFLQSNDSLELIHNHSETCLQANECIGNSLDFIENSRSESVISINSTMSLESDLLKVMDDVELLSREHRSLNSKDASGDKTSGEIFGTPTDTVYHSPIASNCSLITEDFSDDAPLPPTKWYLLSEDDTINTCMRPEQMTSNSRVSNFSANLKQLFPITCAVPDLSTISEISKENEGSLRSFDTDGDNRSSDYQSLV